MGETQTDNLAYSTNNFEPSVRFSQRRAWRRKPVSTWAHCANLRYSFLAKICDVSGQGIALISSVCPPVGTYLHLSFKLPGPTVQSMHRAVVIRHFEKSMASPGETRGMVLQLLDDHNSRQRQRLNDFVRI